MLRAGEGTDTGSSRGVPTVAELAATRRPVAEARLLPPRVFHDAAVFEFEQRDWFGRTWLNVGREADLEAPGTYALIDVATESVIVVRGRDGALRAFHNVCRHRGSTLVDAPLEGDTGQIVRFQCPYHAWIYDLDGSLRRAPHTEELVDFEAVDNELLPVAIDTWAGFVFINLDATAGSLADYLADLPAAVADYPIAGLRRARRIEYEVGANWKVIGENYSSATTARASIRSSTGLSPYDRGRNLESNGPWAGGWMELVDDADTMSVDGRAWPPAPRGHRR